MSFVERLRQLIEDKGVSRTTGAKATALSSALRLWVLTLLISIIALS